MHLDLRPRPGTLGDTDEVVRLRQLMFLEMGASQDETWVLQAARAYRSALSDGSLMAAVIDDPGGLGLVAGGLVLISPVPPGPEVVGSVKAQVSSMSTDRAWRRRGLARLILAALLDRVDARDDVAWTELVATETGIGLYISVGFQRHDHRSLRRPVPARRPSGCDEDPTEELPAMSVNTTMPPPA